jgi:hypothetical protein
MDPVRTQTKKNHHIVSHTIAFAAGQNSRISVFDVRHVPVETMANRMDVANKMGEGISSGYRFDSCSIDDNDDGCCSPGGTKFGFMRFSMIISVGDIGRVVVVSSLLLLSLPSDDDNDNRKDVVVLVRAKLAVLVPALEGSRCCCSGRCWGTNAFVTVATSNNSCST